MLYVALSNYVVGIVTFPLKRGPNGLPTYFFLRRTTQGNSQVGLGKDMKYLIAKDGYY